MNRPLKILLLEDSSIDSEIIQRLLRKEKVNCECNLVMNKEDFLKALNDFTPDVILSDNSLPQLNAADALKLTRERYPHIPFILVTGTVSEEYAANIIKLGADDYILKDRMTRLPAAIDAALRQRRASKEIADYKYALDQSAIVAITDQKGIIRYANDNFRKISKYSCEELVGQDHRIINSGHHPKSYIKELWKVIANGKIWRGEFCNKAKDGSLYWVDTTIIPLLNEKGKPYEYLSIRVDISERKKAEVAFLQSQLRIKQAQEIAHLGNWEVSFETQVSKWSDEAYRIYGIEPGDHNLSIEDWMSFIYPEDRDFVEKAIEKSRSTLSDLSLHHRIVRNDGAIRHVYSESKHEFNSEGRVIGLYGVVHDITEARKAQEEIHRFNERFNLVARATSDVIWDWDLLTGNVYRSTEGLKKVYGFDDNAAIENIGDWSLRIHPDDRARIEKMMVEITGSVNQELFSTEYRFLRQDGTYTYVFDRGFIVRDKKGVPIRMIGAAQDITERKAKEEQLRQLAGHLQDIREEERASMAREIHDELGQQLTGLKIDISWLVKKLASDDNSIIMRTNDILSRLDETIKTVRKIATELRPSLLDDVGLVGALEWQSQEFEKRSGIKTQFQSNLHESQIPDNVSIALFRIFQESLTNVARHSGGTQVISSLTQKDRNMVLVISDNGNGFDIKRIKAKKTLGLLGMKERVLMIGGNYDISSRPGQGTIVSVSVPLPEL